MPVFSSISFAVIGDQQYAVLRIRSSLVQTISPLYTARASTRGMTANRCLTSIAGYGVTGAFAGSGAGRRGGARPPALAGRVNCTTSALRGGNTTKKSSAGGFPTPVTPGFERVQRDWLWGTPARGPYAPRPGSRCA